MGIALIALATPVDNALVKARQSSQIVALHPKPMIALPMAVKRWERRTPLSDVQLSFSLELLPGWNTKKPETIVPVTTLGNRSGLKFILNTNGELSLIVGADTKILPPQEVVIAKHLRAGETTDVAAKVRRSQSYNVLIGGHIVNAFTYNSPVFRAAPQELHVTATPGVIVQRVRLATTFYTSNSASIVGIMMRAAQIIGILCLTVGVLILLQRYLASLFRRAGSKAVLVRVAFGVMGLGELTNILIDLAHPYVSPSKFVDYNSWLFSQYPRFSDFFQVDELLKSLAPYGVSAGSYPPFGYLLLSPMAWFSQYSGLFIFLAAATAFIAWWLWTTFAVGVKKWEAVIISVVGLLSLPVTFALDRGNVDLAIFIMICFATALFERRAFTGSAVIVGLATAAKIFPILYFALFVRRKRRSYLMVGVGAAAIATVVALMAFHGSIFSNVAGFRSAQSQYSASLSTSSRFQTSTYYNASIFAAIQAISLWVGGTSAAAHVHGYMYPYSTAIFVIAMGAVAIWGWRSDGELWRNIGVATIVAVLFSPLSGYYSLLLLFVPLAIFIRQAPVTKWTVGIASVYGFILAPRAWWFIGDAIDVSVAMTGPLLMLLLLMTMRAERERISVPRLPNDQVRLVARSSRPVNGRGKGQEAPREMGRRPVSRARTQ